MQYVMPAAGVYVPLIVKVWAETTTAPLDTDWKDGTADTPLDVSTNPELEIPVSAA
jgi:hypothetical protein